MTKKDYIIIAEALKNAEPTETENDSGTAVSAWVKSIIKVCQALGRQNPRFDGQKFLTACGINN